MQTPSWTRDGLTFTPLAEPIASSMLIPSEYLDDEESLAGLVRARLLPMLDSNLHWVASLAEPARAMVQAGLEEGTLKLRGASIEWLPCGPFPRDRCFKFIVEASATPQAGHPVLGASA
jgi:hypothetical protein